MEGELPIKFLGFYNMSDKKSIFLDIGGQTLALKSPLNKLSNLHNQANTYIETINVKNTGDKKVQL